MFERFDVQAHPDKANLQPLERGPVTHTHPALAIASDDHTNFRALLRLVKSGNRPADITEEMILTERGQVHAEDRQNLHGDLDDQIASEVELCWTHGAPPPVSDLPRLVNSGQLSNDDLIAIFSLYPGQKVL